MDISAPLVTDSQSTEAAEPSHRAFHDPAVPAQTLAAVDPAPGDLVFNPPLSGGVVSLGRQVGVPTPLNRAIDDILALHADGQKVH